MFKLAIGGLAALEGAGLLFALLQYYADPPGAAGSGGPQMALFFFVLVPLSFLAVAIALLVFGRRSRIATGLGAAIVLAPVIGFAYWAVQEWQISRGVAELGSGRGHFEDVAAKALGAAIVRRDGPAIAKLIPQVDLNKPGRYSMTFFKLALQNHNFDLGIAEALLQAGANPNEDGAWPVWIAIYYESPPLLAAVLRAGGDPNTLDSLNMPIFFRAVLHPELIHQLLASGARIEETSFTKRTMLLYAVEERAWRAVDILLAAGANTAAVDRDGKGLADLLREVHKADEDNQRVIAPELLALEARFGGRP